MTLLGVEGGSLGTTLACLRPWPLDAAVPYRQVLAQIGRVSGRHRASYGSLPLQFSPFFRFFLLLHPRALASFIVHAAYSN